MNRLIIITLGIYLVCCGILHAQTKSNTYVDKKGILRWTASDKEITEFGVNYALPFQHAFWANKQLGIPHEKTVDEDIYHLTRLGLKAYRIHIWDSEISDTIGNLLNNEHLRIFDYTVYKMKERGFKMLLTPIAFWPGVPDEGKKLPGFSAKYGKNKSYSNPDAILAAENYLSQFMNHVNPYTGIAYKDDPDIVAFEISNEPEHPTETAEETVIYINRLVKAIRKTGCQKPLFYCLSIATRLLNAFLEADIEGGSSMWYPNGLGAGFTVKNNLLTLSDQWPRDFITDAARAKGKALIAYEMDPADNLNAYTYPQMARILRTKGFQFAAQFAYDPISIASFNSDWQTHYVNLAYVPQKAISLKIAGEVFHRIPLMKDYGVFPADTVFDAFRVSHPENLSEMLTDNKFLYSNSTSSMPPDVAKLNEITGYGSSPIIKYEGRGAYFLDHLGKGIWRLEVMPDATIVNDPFDMPTKINRVVSSITWNTWQMTIDLPDLGNDFKLQGINKGNNIIGNAHDKKISISPGTYLLIKNGVHNKWKVEDKWKDITLGEFIAPEPTQGTYLVHQPVSEIVTGKPFSIRAEVISAEKPGRVVLNIFKSNRRIPAIEMKEASRYEYSADIPEEFLKETGILDYQITVYTNDKQVVYPGAFENQSNLQKYTIRIVNPDYPICLLDIASDNPWIRKPHYSYRFDFVPSSSIPEKYGLKMNEKSMHYISHYFRDGNEVRFTNMQNVNKILIKGEALSDTPVTIWVILQVINGLEYGVPVTFTKSQSFYEISLDRFKRVRLIGGLAEWGNPVKVEEVAQEHERFDIRQVETIKLNVSPTQKKPIPEVVIEYITLNK